MKIFSKAVSYAKKKPFVTGALVFIVGAGIILFMRRGGKSGGADIIYLNPEQDPAVIAAGTQANAAVSMAAIQAGTMSSVEQTRAATALEMQQSATQAAVEINKAKNTAELSAIETITNADIKKTEIVADASRLGKPGSIGIIHNIPNHPVEYASRVTGYTGSFGDGGSYQYQLARLGSDAAVKKWREDMIAGKPIY